MSLVGDGVAAGEDRGARQHALELADVAGPAMLLQLPRRLIVDAADVAIQLGVDGADEVPDQQRQIVAPLAQRRQVNA